MARELKVAAAHEVPPKALEPVLQRAREKGIAVHVGACEKAGDHYGLITESAVRASTEGGASPHRRAS